MKKTFSLLALLLFSTTSYADLTIKGPEKPKRDQIFALTATDAPPNSLFIWTVTPRVKTREVGKDLLLAAPPGTYTVTVAAVTVVVKDNIAIPSKVEAEFEFTVEGKVDPKPGPGPGPGPDPGPDPGPVIGPMSVLITYESAQQHSPTQGPILTSKIIQDYLDAKCKPGTGGRKDWMIADKDYSLTQESTALQEAAKKTKSSLPWISIIPASGPPYDGPLPNSVPETLALLKKYGG